ncbi:hypothetical protein QQ045_012149 [Rhodiola kirilowii]
MLDCWVENPDGDQYKKHLSGVPDFLWVAEDGMAMQCCLRLSMLPSEIVGEKIDPKRLYDTVYLLLYLQSKNGGFALWERAGAPKWLEVLNPTEFFENVVVEHESVEPTASAIQALVLFKELYPGHRKTEIEVSITKAVQYIEDNQRPDGSW